MVNNEEVKMAEVGGRRGGDKGERRGRRKEEEVEERRQEKRIRKRGILKKKTMEKRIGSQKRRRGGD